MAEHAVPHLHNDLGVDRIRIGVKEFNCMGALPPHDHPHVYIDMGAETRAVCPYCSTVYVHDAALPPEGSDPPGCVAPPAETAWRGRDIGRGREKVA